MKPEINSNPRLVDGDEAWTGVNLRVAPESLAEGELAYAENVRCRDGKPTTRPGVVKPIWCHRADAEGRAQSYGESYGAGLFRDPNGRQWHFVACEQGVYRFCENNAPRLVTLPAGVEITAPCTFVQAFNKLYLFRGKNFPTLVLSGTDTGFTDLVPHWTAASFAAGARVLYGTWRTLEAGALTSVAGEARCYLSAHGLVTGQDLTITGADQTEYNGRYTITREDEDYFTYRFGGSATATATGTIKASPQWDLWEASVAVTSDKVPGTATEWVRKYDKLPNADNGLYVQNRLLVPTALKPGTTNYDETSTYVKKDFLVATDYSDNERFQWHNNFRINQGSDDELVDLVKFTDDTVLVFKDRSWGVLSGIGEDMANTLKLDMQGLAEGAVARGAVVRAGADVIFLSARRGLVSVRQTEQGKIQSVNLPLSDEIEPWIRRINWEAARRCARLEYWDNYLWAAVPMDGAEVNNAILVYDFVLQKWQGRDTGSAICVQEFYHAEVAGEDRLFYLGSDGYVNLVGQSDCGDQTTTDPGAEILPTTTRFNGSGLLFFEGLTPGRTYVWERGNASQIESGTTILSVADGAFAPQFATAVATGGAGQVFTGRLVDANETGPVWWGWEEIAFLARTRAYFTGLADWTRAMGGELAVETRDPKYSLSLVYAGQGEGEDLVTDRTKDPTKYWRPWNLAAWDPSNVNDDHGTAGREDYTVRLSAAGVSLGADGVAMGLTQTHREVFRLGRWQQRGTQLEVTNSQGTLKLHYVRLGAIEGQKLKMATV